MTVIRPEFATQLLKFLLRERHKQCVPHLLWSDDKLRQESIQVHSEKPMNLSGFPYRVGSGFSSSTVHTWKALPRRDEDVPEKPHLFQTIYI